MANLSLLSVAKDSLGVSPPFSVVKDVLGFVHSPPASLKHRLQMKGRMKRARRISLRSYFDFGNPDRISIREEIRQYAIWQHSDLGGQAPPDFGLQAPPAPVINMDSENKISLREVINLDISPKVLSLKSFFHIPVYYTPTLISIREKIRAISSNSTISIQDTLNKNSSLKVLSLRTYFHIPSYRPPDPVSILDKIRQYVSIEGKSEVSLRTVLHLNPIPQTSSLRRFFHIPEYHAPDHISVREKISAHLAVFGEPTSSNSSISLQKVLNKNFYMLVFGDSVTWGLGLKPEDKFSSLTKQRIMVEYPNVEGFSKTLAHSGAIIGVGNNGTSERLDGEVNSSYPTILQQVDLYEGIEETVDLILVDGGINDVDVFNIIDPTTSDSDLEDKVDKYCYRNLKILLERLVNKYPNAVIVTTGYYPIISNDSISTSTYLFLFGLGFLAAIAHFSIPELAEQSKNFSDHAAQKMKQAIKEVNESLELDRVLYASPNFDSENCLFGSKSWLWGLDYEIEIPLLDEIKSLFGDSSPDLDLLQGVDIEPEDDTKNTRREKCDECKDLLPYEKCRLSSAGHPNRTGATKYAQQIEKVLKKIGLLTTGSSSSRDLPRVPVSQKPGTVGNILFVLNINKGHLEIHRRDCVFAGRIQAKNKLLINGDPTDVEALYLNGILPLSIIDDLIAKGYDGCYHCLKQYHTK